MPDSLALAPSRELLRFLVCGSVDDGKSTLIGRLLFETGSVPEDQLATLARESRRHGTTGDDPDYALLLDGLEAEQQQGITIDVAWRYFSTPQRAFIVADAPGHAQYTRNMATGATYCSLAVLLVDATQGLLEQTRRHAIICALLGIRDVVLAVNKMDLVGYDKAAFSQISAVWRGLAASLGFSSAAAVPLSARHGENLVRPLGAMPWYDGPGLLALLEAAEVSEDPSLLPFRFPVQWVSRPHADFRGFAGTIGSGHVKVGDPVAVASSGRGACVARIVTMDGDLIEARAGQAVTLVLDEPVDISRGDLLVGPSSRPAMADQFAAKLLWLDEEPLLPGRGYALRLGHLWTTASVTSNRYTLDVATGDKHPARRLELNEIGLCHFAAAQRLPIDPYEDNRATGAFILVDQLTKRTVGAGMMAHPLHQARNIHPEAFPVDGRARAALAGQKPLVVWFTGLSGSGKSTIAKHVEQALHAAGRHTYSLDGDNLRHGLCRDLGFTAKDRVENIRRAGEVARLMLDAGLIVLCAFISPYRAERQMVRGLFGPDEFCEVFVDASIEICMRRDPKGLYAKAQMGLIPNFTGMGSPYEPPEAPELHLRTDERSPEESVAEVLAHLRVAGMGI
jgi:bifunctional enzyme CysN/CysC